MQKTLEWLLTPFKKVDEGLLRQYTKLTKRWEDTGRSRYSLATLFNLPAIVALLGAASLGTSHVFNTMTAGFGSWIGGYDTGLNVSGLETGQHPTGIQAYGDRFVVNNRFAFLMEKTMKLIRSPLFLYGSACLVKGALSLSDHLMNDDG